MVAFYGAALAIVFLFVVFRTRELTLNDTQTGHSRQGIAGIDPTRAAAKKQLSGKIDDLDDFEGIGHEGRQGLVTRAAKRFVDVVLCLVLIVIFLPMLLVTAIAIKLESPGPVFYRQKRVGLGGDVFDVFKFRSMAVDAEKDGPRWAEANDNRTTRVGRFIRKTRIDEIPQTLNVLRGEMSFVGPRPERPEFVKILEAEIPHYHSRHSVKPGITGWAQVKYEYAASVEGAREKLKYDLYYIKKFTPFLDILIIVMTVRVVMFGIGSR